MNRKSVNIVGAGGHSRSVIALLKDNNYSIDGIYDATWKPHANEVIMKVPVKGNIEMLPPDTAVCLAVGDNQLREQLCRTFHQLILKPNIVHSTAYVESSVISGESNLIFGRVFINAMAVVGNNNILNTGCIIEHECVIGSNNHISVSAVLCGRVKVGDNCFIGAGVVVKDKIKITSGVTIGAGAVVIRDVETPGVYVGNPLRRIK